MFQLIHSCWKCSMLIAIENITSMWKTIILRMRSFTCTCIYCLFIAVFYSLIIFITSKFFLNGMFVKSLFFPKSPVMLIHIAVMGETFFRNKIFHGFNILIIISRLNIDFCRISQN